MLLLLLLPPLAEAAREGSLTGAVVPLLPPLSTGRGCVWTTALHLRQDPLMSKPNPSTAAGGLAELFMYSGAGVTPGGLSRADSDGLITAGTGQPVSTGCRG